MKPPYELLRTTADFAGCSDLEIEFMLRDLGSASTEALIDALRRRGIKVELHLFDRRYREVAT